MNQKKWKENILKYSNFLGIIANFLLGIKIILPLTRITIDSIVIDPLEEGFSKGSQL